MTAIIQTEHLTKTYGVAPGDHRGRPRRSTQGEVFGFLGPNGAGKTTTIRTVLDLIRPTSGRALVFGIETHRRPGRRSIAGSATSPASSACTTG